MNPIHQIIIQQSQNLPLQTEYLKALKRHASRLSHLCLRDSAKLWTVVHQAPLSMGFSREEYWRTLRCPPPGYLPNLRNEPTSAALQVVSLLTEPPGKPFKEAQLLNSASKNSAENSSIEFVIDKHLEVARKMNGKRKVRDSKKRSINHTKQNSVKLLCQRGQMGEVCLFLFFLN